MSNFLGTGASDRLEKKNASIGVPSSSDQKYSKNSGCSGYVPVDTWSKLNLLVNSRSQVLLRFWHTCPHKEGNAGGCISFIDSTECVSFNSSNNFLFCLRLRASGLAIVITAAGNFFFLLTLQTERAEFSLIIFFPQRRRLLCLKYTSRCGASVLACLLLFFSSCLVVSMAGLALALHFRYKQNNNKKNNNNDVFSLNEVKHFGILRR